MTDAAPGVDTGLRDAIEAVLLETLGWDWQGADHVPTPQEAIRSSVDAVLALLPVGPEVRPETDAGACTCGHPRGSLACRSQAFHPALPVGDAPTRPDVQPERLWSAPHGGHGVEAVRWPVYRAALADLAAARAETWDEAVEATMDWVANNPGPSGIPVDPPGNPYAAALARASSVPAEGRCSYCGHAPHGGWCPNMASDNDCACDVQTLAPVPAEGDGETDADWLVVVDHCPVHVGVPEPCPTCQGYIAGGL